MKHRIGHVVIHMSERDRNILEWLITVIIGIAIGAYLVSKGIYPIYP